MNIVALIMAFVMAIVPTAAIIDIDGDEVFVEINDEIFSFYGEGFSIGEQIQVVFVSGEIREVLPW